MDSADAAFAWSATMANAIRAEDSDRPIVRSSTREELHKLYDTRSTIYQKRCTAEIDASKTPGAAVRAIIELLGLGEQQ